MRTEKYCHTYAQDYFPTGIGRAHTGDIQIPTTININKAPPTDLNQVIKAALTGDEWTRVIEEASECAGQFGTQTSFSSLIKFKSRDVLIDHRRSEQGWFLQVPGYVIGKYKTPQEKTVPITEVEPISDVNDRKELTDLLRQRHEKIAHIHILFWNQD